MLTGTAHFSLAEVMANTEWPIPVIYQDNAQATLLSLESYRSILGVPLRLTSLWRSPDANAVLPGSAPDSRHLTANAADVVPVGMSLAQAANKLAAAQAAGDLPPFDQILIESDHLHIDPGGAYGYRNEALVADGAGNWVPLATWAGQHPVAASGVAAGVLFRGGPDSRPVGDTQK